MVTIGLATIWTGLYQAISTPIRLPKTIAIAKPSPPRLIDETPLT